MARSRFIHLQLGDRLWEAIVERTRATGATTHDVVVAALHAYLGLDEAAYQTSTIGAVMDGVYHGDITVRELREHGDIGIGTFDALDGEMIMVDGVVYRVDGHCAAHPAADEARTPFATVTHWTAKHSSNVPRGTDLAGLQSRLDTIMSSHNYLYAVRAECRFASIKVRSVKPQDPGTRLVDATRSQTVKTFEGCEGTLVGFFTPEFLAHVNVPGLHLHFITRARDAGGHVLAASVDEGTVMTDETTRLSLALPDSEEFRTAALAVDKDELQTAET
jgi:acetolactate decarboxylase